jgi:hypothetical protein
LIVKPLIRPDDVWMNAFCGSRLILENAVAPKIGLGSALVAIGQTLGGVDLDFPRDKPTVEPASFE